MTASSDQKLESHPSWVRGLKHCRCLHLLLASQVAPLVGAWIETTAQVSNAPQMQVAPLVGAWIETRKAGHVPVLYGSHPSWVRGLKHPLLTFRFCLCWVAPLVGAWIETMNGTHTSNGR